MLNQYSFGKRPQIVAKKSLTAYVKPMGIWFIAWLFFSVISWVFSLIFIIIGLGIILYINSFKLFIDEEGVWVFRGFLPWDKGIYGVKWRDFGEALFYQNPVSWSLKSYTILIKNKYKRDDEIILKNMHNGDIAVSKINSISTRVKY